MSGAPAGRQLTAQESASGQYGVGGAPSVAPRLVLAEITAAGLAAVVVGIALGVHLAWMGVGLYHDLAGLQLALDVPILPTLVGSGGVVIAALLGLIRLITGVLSVLVV